MVYVSVDGGATKTLAVCYDMDGRILGMGVSGPSNFRNVGIRNTRDNLSVAISRSIDRSGVSGEEVEGVTFALAGVGDSVKSTQTIEDIIGGMKLEEPVTLLNDGEAGYNCRFFGKDGIVVAAGTGMVAYGRIGIRFERISGWGWLIGDEGSAFYIGRRAIQEASRIADNRSCGSKEFLFSIEDFFGVADPREMVNEVYTEPVNIRKIALAARLVSVLADRGDSVAVSLIREAASEAGICVIGMKDRFGGDNLPVSGYGGVFRSGRIFWEKFKDTVNEAYPDTAFLPPLFGYHAVLGSVYLTLGKAGADHLPPEVILREFNEKITSLPLAEKSQYLLLD